MTDRKNVQLTNDASFVLTSIKIHPLAMYTTDSSEQQVEGEHCSVLQVRIRERKTLYLSWYDVRNLCDF